MLEWAKIIHEAIGIESPRLFIGLFAFGGLLFFGAVGWLVDHGYRVKLSEQSSRTDSQNPRTNQRQNPPNPTPLLTPKETPVGKDDKSKTPTRTGDINIGSNSPIAGSTINTGTINSYGPLKPFVLSTENQDTARTKLKAGFSELSLVCIGKGCQTAESLLPAFSGTDWKIQRTVIGVFSGVTVGTAGAAVDIGSGIHLMEKDADANAVGALRSALESVGIKFEYAPWRPFGPARSSSGIILVIGSPE